MIFTVETSIDYLFAAVNNFLIFYSLFILRRTWRLAKKMVCGIPPPPPPPPRGGEGGVAIYKQGAALYYYKVGGCVNQIDTSLSIYYKHPYLQYFHKLATSQDQSHFVLYKDNWYPI